MVVIFYQYLRILFPPSWQEKKIESARVIDNDVNAVKKMFIGSIGGTIEEVVVRVTSRLEFIDLIA